MLGSTRIFVGPAKFLMLTAILLLTEISMYQWWNYQPPKVPESPSVVFNKEYQKDDPISSIKNVNKADTVVEEEKNQDDPVDAIHDEGQNQKDPAVDIPSPDKYTSRQILTHEPNTVVDEIQTTQDLSPVTSTTDLNVSARQQEHASFKCTIPKIIHQTWKTSVVSSFFGNNIKSWWEKNPEYEYQFWTDDKNRDFVSKHFPSYVKMFDSFPENIQRADAIRYFILSKVGGIYADLDFRALQSFNTLLAGDVPDEEFSKYGVILGQEPRAHALILYNQRMMVCNAIMASCPGHPFWKVVLEEMRSRAKTIKTVRATGPKMITAAVQKYLQLHHTDPERYPAIVSPDLARFANLNVSDISASSSSSGLYIPEPEVFYPYFDDGNVGVQNMMAKCRQTQQVWGRSRKSRHHATFPADGSNESSAELLKLKLLEDRYQLCQDLKHSGFRNDPPTNKSYAVHLWTHTWLNKYKFSGTGGFGFVKVKELMQHHRQDKQRVEKMKGRAFQEKKDNK